MYGRGSADAFSVNPRRDSGTTQRFPKNKTRQSLRFFTVVPRFFGCPALCSNSYHETVLCPFPSFKDKVWMHSLTFPANVLGKPMLASSAASSAGVHIMSSSAETVEDAIAAAAYSASDLFWNTDTRPQQRWGLNHGARHLPAMSTNCLERMLQSQTGNTQHAFPDVSVCILEHVSSWSLGYRQG